LRALPLVLPPPAPSRVADEAEAADAGGQGQFGHQFEQAFVDAAEFLGIHVAVIDARERGAVAEEAEAEERAEQRLVVELGGVEVRALRDVEEATERRQAKGRLAAGEAGEGDRERLPEVGMAVVAAPPGGRAAQAGETVAGLVAGSGLGAGVGREDEFAVFDGGEKDEAVDEAQELLEVDLGAQLAAFDAAAQLAVGRMREKAAAEHAQGIGDAFAQAVADADAVFLGGVAPVFERAVGGLGAGLAETRGVGEQPEGGEIGVEAFAEDGFEVGLDVGRPGEAGVVAQDAQLQAVADDGPQHGVAGVEILLGEQEGRTAARAVAVPAARLVERLVVRGEDERHAPFAGGAADGEAAFADGDLADALEVGKAEYLAAEGFEEVAAVGPGVAVAAFAAGGEILPEVLGDLPVAADLVAQLEAARDVVVGLGLRGGFEMGDPVEEIGRQQAAFDGQGGEGEFGARAAGHAGSRFSWFLARQASAGSH
jgi:hypothetical protein